MTQAPEPQFQPPPPGPPPPPHAVKPSRLYQAAAWVVIVAGTVFVVAVIFFAGAFVAGHDHPFRHHHGMFGPGGSQGPEGMVVFPGPFPPGTGPGWPGGPGGSWWAGRPWRCPGRSSHAVARAKVSAAQPHSAVSTIAAGRRR